MVHKLINLIISQDYDSHDIMRYTVTKKKSFLKTIRQDSCDIIWIFVKKIEKMGGLRRKNISKPLYI